jgi:protein-L-isoaspartate(D-aspartate) O-methyltransferase
LSEVDVNALHQGLVEGLVEREVIHSGAVEAAFRAVPRHLFLLGLPPDEAYKDDAIPTKKDDSGLAISSSTQPSMMAIMLEQLALQPGDNVLEIGAGTGFNAAVMGHIVGEGGHVTTIDIDLDIVEGAQEHLTAAGCTNVTVVCGDGAKGFTGNDPYDAVILTVGAWEIVPAWLEQLKRDGRLLLPLSLNGPQFSIAFEREGGGLVSRSVVACGFMTLRGENAGPAERMPVNAEGTISLGYADNPERPRRINAGKVQAWLAGTWQDSAVGLAVTTPEIWRGFNLWMALREPELVSLGARGEVAETMPLLLGAAGPNSWGMTVGIVGEEGMAFFVRPSVESAEEEAMKELNPFDLYIRAYGTADALVERLKRQALDWDRNGRVGTDGMRVRVYPLDSKQEGEIVLKKHWHQFVVDWP